MAEADTGTRVAQGKRARADAATAARLRTHSSSLIAKVLEYQLLGAIGAELLARGKILEILRTDVDADGHDVVLETNGVVRHVQLKTRVQGGATRKVSCHTRLTSKPSGCIVAIAYDPATYQPVGYDVFGAAAGRPLIDIGDVVARRATHNKRRERPLRADHRDISYSRFVKIPDVGSLVDWLFHAPANSGEQAHDEIMVVSGPPGTPMTISCGSYSVLPMSINHTDGTALVVIVDDAERGSRAVMAGMRDIAEQPGTWVILDLRKGSWSFGSELDRHPTITVLLSRAIEELAARLEPQES